MSQNRRFQMEQDGSQSPDGDQSNAMIVTIVTESILEARLTRDIEACGARGWTITDARGHGPRNRRASELEGGNIRLETIVTEPVAAEVMEVLSRDYFPSYAVAAWTVPVHVTRVARYA
jgi:nitrogen regulatory protein P-II 2